MCLLADDGLFGSGSGKENSTHGHPIANPSPKPSMTPSGIGGGLFDDEEGDDFFSGRSLKTSSSGKSVWGWVCVLRVFVPLGSRSTSTE